ncbi:unnamed protein product [Arctogadus glacialis]
MKSTEVDQGLFTDSYCRVCSAQLISESQRVAHYETLPFTQCHSVLAPVPVPVGPPGYPGTHSAAHPSTHDPPPPSPLHGHRGRTALCETQRETGSPRSIPGSIIHL